MDEFLLPQRLSLISRVMYLQNLLKIVSTVCVQTPQNDGDDDNVVNANLLLLRGRRGIWLRASWSC